VSWDDADDDDTMPCPYCRRAIHDDAVQCPHCGNYLSEEDAPARHSWWFLAGVILCLILALGWALQKW
jgi:predicted nucleic acid-binding Zn ribbon protein